MHLNDALSDVDKFTYLRSLLEESAFNAIAGPTLSSANYQEAIDILKKRFGDRQMIISRHMDVLLNLTAVTLENDLKGLPRICNDADNQSENSQPAQSLSLDETYADGTLVKPHSTKSTTVKVLGVVWDLGEHNLQFSVADIAEVAAATEPTKRNVVSIIGRFYDPLGYLAPAIIRFKRLFQKLCEQRVERDECLLRACRRNGKAGGGLKYTEL